MSAPLVSEPIAGPPRVRLHALPEYEPSRRTGPPEPDHVTVSNPAPAFDPVTGPLWDEPGQSRNHLARLVGLILEAVDGRRPLPQVQHLVTPAVYASLRTRSRQHGGTGRRYQPRSLHTCRPAPDTVELCATVAITAPHRRARFVAFAARFVEHPTGWQCTVFRQLHPNPPQ